MGWSLETLTYRQRDFARYFARYRVAAKAARLAGYSNRGHCAAVIGSRLLRNPGVIDAIAIERQAAVEEANRAYAGMVSGLQREYQQVRDSNPRKALDALGRIGYHIGALPDLPGPHSRRA